VAGNIIYDAYGEIQAVSPAGAVGQVDVTVTTPGGKSVKSYQDTFTYIGAPVAVTATYSTSENTPLNVAGPGVLTYDTDPQGDTLAADLLANPANGTLSLGSDGSFVYTPNSGFFGQDAFVYQADNGYLTSEPSVVVIDVYPPGLTWDGTVNGNWTDAHWVGGPPAFPDTTVDATVDTASVVHVTSSQAAEDLALTNGGEVVVASGGNLAVAGATSVTGGATLSVDSNGFFTTGGTLTLDTGGSVTGGPVSAAAYQLNDGTASANLSGPGGLTKDTGGTVILSGSNSYAGGTTVLAGTLIVSGSASLPAGSSLTIGAGGTFVFDPSQATAGPDAGAVVYAAGIAAAPDASTPVVAAGAIDNAAVAASAVSTLSPAISAVPDNPAATPLSIAPAATTTVYDAVQQMSAVVVPSSTLSGTGGTARAASASVATNASSLATPATMSSLRVDAVFKSYRSALDQTAASADNAQSARAWAWLAASESFWNSSDQNKTTDSATAALDKVLARFGV
jgi:autotransporter-associated beta strand protein